MRKRINILLALVAIAALVATTVVGKEWLASAKADKAALAAVLEKNNALKTQIDGLKPVPETSRQTAARARKPATKNTARDERLDQAKARLKALEEHKKNDREFGLKYYAAVRSNVDTQYGPFYRLHHLTKGQREALAGALFQRQLRYESIKAETLANGPDADAQTARAGADAELATAAQEALGADLHGRFQLYERQRQAWNYVANLGGMLSLVDMPLSLEQAARLVDAIANANASFQKGGAVTLMDVAANGFILPRIPMAEDWSAVDAAAADFLTPEQLDFFKTTEVPVSVVGSYSRQRMELSDALGNLPSE